MFPVLGGGSTRGEVLLAVLDPPRPLVAKKKRHKHFPLPCTYKPPAPLALGFGLGLGVGGIPWHVRHWGCGRAVVGEGGLWARLGGLLGGSRGGGLLFGVPGGLLVAHGRVRTTSGGVGVGKEEEEEESVEDSKEGSEEDLPGSLFLFFGGD